MNESQPALMKIRLNGIEIPVRITLPEAWRQTAQGYTVNTTLDVPPVSAGSQPSAVDPCEATPASSSASGPRRRDLERFIAMAITDVRRSLEGDDCKALPIAGRSAILARAMKLAEFIGREPYGGMAVFGDDEEGELELVVDSRDAKRRLAIVWRAADGMFMSQKINGKVESSKWMKDIYNLADLAEWLTGVKRSEVVLEIKTTDEPFIPSQDLSTVSGTPPSGRELSLA